MRGVQDDLQICSRPSAMADSLSSNRSRCVPLGMPCFLKFVSVILCGATRGYFVLACAARFERADVTMVATSVVDCHAEHRGPYTEVL